MIYKISTPIDRPIGVSIIAREECKMVLIALEAASHLHVQRADRARGL